jgi:pyruvate ferredoxin oxidoreductase alpha subunit
LFEDAGNDELEQLTFLDLNSDIVQHELERESETRRPGPTAEAILRRIGTVASRIG